MLPLILASSSIYRRELLQKLALPFSWANPAIDETPLANEAPPALVERLAQAKAAALIQRYPRHLIIGSDQVACLDGRILGKPGNFAAAQQQLHACNGRRVEFLTGLCLLNSRDNTSQSSVELFSVVFRRLSDAQIANYLEREQPFDCAGSFKAEGLGIALFERLEGGDPNSLIGLPLIRLIQMLENAGAAVI
ncbi:MAG TPA: nucleoside triphosphate pyrophosphatase [Spongiibacteraceae bacterium]|nr:nucleoside triphosphate pyrophosphatase [Spongiibacteraceae bacterium]